MRILVLGGTGEARELAGLLDGRPGITVTSSLAGAVSHPALPAGRTVVGGFGGATGLAEFLARERIDAVVDATHPFARRITENAVTAARTVGVPLLVLRRPRWGAVDGDDWTKVPSVEEAAHVAASLCAPPDCIFVTTGRRDLAPFAAHPIRRFLVRAVEEPPPGSLPPNSTLLLDRGPYTVDSELTLFDRHRVGVVVSRDSGGPATYAKIEAARTRAIPVVLVDRPALPDPPPSTVDTVAAALSWCL